MRQISQGLRESYELGEEVCKEFLQHQLTQLIEVRVGRHGKVLPEVQSEFKDICKAALTFEDAHFIKKLEEFSKQTVGVGVDAKKLVIAEKQLLILKLVAFVDADCSTGQSSTVLQVV